MFSLLTLSSPLKKYLKRTKTIDKKMRKIVSKHEEGRKKKRNQLIIGGVLMAVMLFSIIGYAFENYITGNTSSSNPSVTYNNVVFTQQNGYWGANYSGSSLLFSYNPGQVSLNASLASNINDFFNKPLYIYSYDSNAEAEIRNVLYPFTSQIQDACPSGMQCSQGQLPVENCSSNFIIIQGGNASVSQQDNCIYISGQGQNLIMSVDAVLFKILGIKQ